MHVDPSGASFVLALAIGFFVGALIGGGFEIASQIKNHGFNISNWNGNQIMLSALGGGVAGMISAIPIGGAGFLSYLGTFGLGGLASVSGGLISGSVSFADPSTILVAFAVCGVANVMARGISSKINKMVADKSQRTLQNSLAFKDMRLADLIGTGVSNIGVNPAYVRLTNEAVKLVSYSNGVFAKSMIYSFTNSSASSIFSGWY